MLFERPEAGRRAAVLNIELNQAANPDCDEFVELARSAEIDTVAVVRARREVPHPRTFIGSGKVQEVHSLLHACDADLLLVNHELSAGQQRNLEGELECRVITRTELILTIFASRARSHEGQLQVELAQLKHAQTRLVRGWTHLDRQKGGIGLRGAGEKQIELDQRMLSERIKVTEKKLVDVARRRSQSRRNRDRRGTPTIALVGYTNAGKSTLFNRLTHSDVYAEDQLFATLDPTMRKIEVPGLNDVVLVDTVGFVSLLPHALVEAFKATLEEVIYADLLLHVVDASDPLMEERVEQVRSVLEEIGAGEVPEFRVFNKIDLLAVSDSVADGVENKEIGADERASQDVTVDVDALERVETQDDVPAQGWLDCGPSAHKVSALTGAGIEDLIEGIGAALGVVAPHEVILQPADGKIRAWLYESGAVLNEIALADGRLQLTLQADEYLLAKLRETPRVLLRQSDSTPKISSAQEIL